MQLKHKQTRKRVNVLCVHLKAFEEFSKLRAEQTGFLLNILKETLVDKNDIETRLAQQPILICGDFNGDTHEQFYKLLVNQNSNANINYTKISDSSNNNENYIDLSDAYDSYRKFNANQNVNGNNNTNNVSRNVDYIFYTRSTLKLINYLNLETEKHKMLRFPDLTYPSDHLSLVCDFQFN
jgi:nocturnin